MTQLTKRTSSTQATYKCKACNAAFVRETAFLNHKCKQMIRAEEMKSPIGQAAWNYYQQWIRQQKRLPPSNSTAFLTSKYYRSFIEFAKFVRRVDLPLPDKFIWLMVEKKFSPVMWREDEVYTTYIEFLDCKLSPIEQAKLSINTILKYADKHNLDTSAVFEHIDVQDLIQMIRTRKLSPWLLLFSKSFKHLFSTRMSAEQQIIVENLIRPGFWGERKQKFRKEISAIKMLIAEMGV